MQRVVSLFWRWRWLLALLLVVAVSASYYLRWRSEEKRIATLLAQGEQAIVDRDYPAAREHLTAYLDARPKDARVRWLVADVARQLRLYEQAGEALRACRQSGGDDEAIETEYALMAVEQGDPRPIPALRARVADKDDSLSLTILEVLIQHDLNLYQLRDAQQGFNLYLKRKPDDLYALLGRGRLWERFLSYTDAVVDYRRAVAVHPDNELAHRWLAAALLLVGTPSEALEQYRWLDERVPNDPAVQLGLAKCHRQLGRPDKALALLDGVLGATPNSAEALWERGQLEIDRGRPVDAEPWLRRADQAAPFDRRIVFSLFNCLQTLGRPDAGAVKARGSN